jgi:excisionase family DNA binding protein|nr:MAG TPA: helix-turn-helix domain protein [Bacteriophage sp.]
MNLKTYSEPITGLDFQGLTDDRGNISIETAFNGVIRIAYNEASGTYTIPAYLLQHRPTMTLNECAAYLGVSKVRVSRMCSNGRLRAVKIRGSLVIDSASAESAKKEMVRDAD